MKAIIIDHAKGQPEPARIETVDIDGSLEALQGIVGGNLEMVTLNERAAVYVRDDDTGLAENLPATLFVQAACAETGRGLVGRIHGPMVVFGLDGSENEADVPDRELTRADALRAIVATAP